MTSIRLVITLVLSREIDLLPVSWTELGEKKRTTIILDNLINKV